MEETIGIIGAFVLLYFVFKSQGTASATPTVAATPAGASSAPASTSLIFVPPGISVAAPAPSGNNPLTGCVACIPPGSPAPDPVWTVGSPLPPPSGAALNPPGAQAVTGVNPAIKNFR